MAFTKLSFTKSWRTDESLPYFPTTESSEAQVRADMQLQPNEIKTRLNGLTDELEAGTAAASLGAKDSSSNTSTVQAELNKLTAAMPNVKLFTLSSTSDLTNAQAAYSWIVSGGLAIISIGGNNYIYDNKNSTSTEYIFNGTEYYKDYDYSETQGTTVIGLPAAVHFTVSSGTVTNINVSDATEIRVLEADHNYSPAYSPEYDGSPATKEYVDDHHDSTKQDTISDLATIRSNASAGAAKVSCTDATVGGFGYTKNTGTVTSVSVKMNGTTKGTVTASGEIDLGTVITEHQSKSDIGLGNVDNTSDATKKTNFTGSIASGNTGFVTGGDVYTAIGNVEAALAALR